MKTSKETDFTEYRAIAIPLQSSGSITEPSNYNEYQEQFFVGRKNITPKLVDLLQSTRQRGSYLIAGYRGSGKTSMVDKAILLAEKKSSVKMYEVRINLGDNSQLTPLHIYYSIANILRNTIADGNNRPKSPPPPMRKRILKWMWKFFLEPSIRLRDISIVSVFLACIASSILLLNPETISIVYDFSISKLIPILLFLTASSWMVLYIKNYNEIKALRDIDELIERMSYEITEERNATLRHDSSIGFSNSIGFSKHRKRLPIKAREAEEQLIRILNHNGLFDIAKTKIIIVMDEIDKLSDDEELSEIHHHYKSSTQEPDKSSKINTLLGSLKNFITTAPVTFFFISGRETLDRYYSEKGSPNSLYGSLFDQVFEIPSLLSDKGEQRSARNTQLYAGVAEYVCRRIRKIPEKEEEEEEDSYYTLEKYRESLCTFDISPEEIRYSIAILMNFIFYLTFHSWGNPKKLSSIFESFTYPNELVEQLKKKENLHLILDDKDSGEDNKPKQWLVFNVNHLRSFSLASEITTLFQHHLSREVSQISDKLTVSSFSSLHFILKLHSYGFKRESLHLMSEAINVYRSPELNTIVDDLLTNIFKSYIRRVRNGLYRYRFHSGFEQELRYISHVSGLESASFNFSLDSMRYVKRFFEVILANTSSSETDVISRSHISLGDMCTIEQSYNAASIHYHTASRILANTLKEEGSSINQETLMQYIEVLLKHGDLEERRQNYNHATAIYSEADHIVQS
ncbi:P-loop NTPase fold protein, partial [Nitrosomonas sp.]|uniref:P-loop NTPase fold protein n=1 Tax=Nitrosomonas sp. TaxID=42353 RepID=UPI00272F1A11